MRKCFPGLALASIMLTGILSGCNNNIINLASEVVVVPVGEEISTDVSDYVRASKTMLAGMSVDVSKVNKDVIGTYSATVTYQDSVKEFYIQVADENSPEIELTGSELTIDKPGTISIDEVVKSISDFSKYEYGFSDNMKLSDKNKQITDTITFGAAGEYLVEVLAKDEYDNYAVEQLIIKVGVGEAADNPVSEGVDYAEFMNTNPGVELADLESYDSTAVSYGVGAQVDEANRPIINYYTENFGQFAVDFIQPESEYVWLTFNEIAEYGNTMLILDTLKEKDVKAVFFITLSYAKNNPDIIKRMLDEGHELGNYTANCSKVPELSVNNLTSEIDTLYNYVYQTYGYEMYLFRTPSGNFSAKALAVAQSKGYRTVFWSFNYADWNINNQPPVEEALNNALNRAHGGAIYLLSGASTTNQQMLGDLIDGIRDKGYEFAEYQKN